MQKTQKKILSFLHKCAINEDQMMHGSWDIKCKGQSFWVLPLLTTQKIKIFEKQKKHLKILPFYFSGTKNHDHILYFLPLPLTTLGIRILKKWKKKKKHLEMSSFYISGTKYQDHICYTVPEIWHVTDVIFTFHFGLFFAVLPP